MTPPGGPAAAAAPTALVYIDTPADADHFLDQLTGITRLALDTEGASFHRFVDRIYLLQLTAPARSAIDTPTRNRNCETIAVRHAIQPPSRVIATWIQEK